MNHGNFNGFDDWTQYCCNQFSDSQLRPVAEQEFGDDQLIYKFAEHEFADNQFHPVGTTTSIAAQASEIMQPGRLVNVRGGDPAKLERKRKSDREYRQRCKDKNKRTEEELKVLRAKQQTLALKPDGEQYDSDQLCKIEFRLDCYNDKLRGEAMKAVGEFPGMKWFSMDVEEKILTFYGNSIDTLPLQHKLKEVCNARMLSFSIVKKKDEEKKDGRIVMDMVVARSSTLVAQNSTSSFPHNDSVYPDGGRPEGRLHVSEAAFISFTSVTPARCCGLF